MAIVVVGAVFVDVKGFPDDLYLPTGRNAGSIEAFRTTCICRPGATPGPLSLSTAAWAAMWRRISPMWSCAPPS